MGIEQSELIGGAVKPDELWACTTCRACMQECPVFVEHLDEIIGMRRYLTMVKGNLPSSVSMMLRNLNGVENPWGLPKDERIKWAEGLDITMLEEGGNTEVLYWVGCLASYDPRNQKIAHSYIY